GKTLALALATARGEPLDLAPRGRPSPATLLWQALATSGVFWGILTNGQVWRLVHLPTDEPPPLPYEVDPSEHRAAPFSPEPCRYFTLCFRASAFSTPFVREALAGSAAARSASVQALLSRAKTFLAEEDGAEAALPLLSRALFALFGAARGDARLLD